MFHSRDQLTYLETTLRDENKPRLKKEKKMENECPDKVPF